MSYWTFVHGTVVVEPSGRTQHEKEYILKTVLDHLPRVTGSEGDMEVYVIQKRGYDECYFYDEFGQLTDKVQRDGLSTQSKYILVLDGRLRDRSFENTFRKFMKWIVRLSKRIEVIDVLVEVTGYEKSVLIKDNYKKYCKMFEDYSWIECKNEKTNWCEYLMWDHSKRSSYPLTLSYKYGYDKTSLKEIVRRKNYYLDN